MIELDGVGVIYPGGVEALKPSSLCFDKGEITVLLGTSGAGKSTLLRCINRMVAPTTGTIRSAASGIIDRGRTLRRHRRETAMVFQQHQLIGRLPVLSNVLTGRLAYHSTWRTILPLPAVDRHLALKCLERVGLLDFALRRADSLSGGQQQRVGIARALAQQPSFILADEPVASLDPATSARILALLSDICKSDSLGAVISLHQVDLARRFADRIVGIVDGAIVFNGHPGDLTEHHLARIYKQPVRPHIPTAVNAPDRSPELVLTAAME
jgi:phosphonate transport system ATP-binding protein